MLRLGHKTEDVRPSAVGGVASVRDGSVLNDLADLAVDDVVQTGSKCCDEGGRMCSDEMRWRSAKQDESDGSVYHVRSMPWSLRRAVKSKAQKIAFRVGRTVRCCRRVT